MLYICRVPFGAVVLGYVAMLGIGCVDNMTKPTAKPAPIVAPVEVKSEPVRAANKSGMTFTFKQDFDKVSVKQGWRNTTYRRSIYVVGDRVVYTFSTGDRPDTYVTVSGDRKSVKVHNERWKY